MRVCAVYPIAKGKASKGMERRKKLIVYIEPYANCKSLEISLLFVQKHSTQHVFRILDKFFYIFIHKIMFSAANECVFLLLFVFASLCVRVLFSQVNTIESIFLCTHVHTARLFALIK